MLLADIPIRIMILTQTKISVLFVFALICLVVGVTLTALWSKIYQQMLEHELVLTDHSTSYQIWKDIPIPIYMQFYLFNWTNVAEMQKDPTIKPAFVELGPYVFRERHRRVNVTWNDNSTVTYQQVRSWHFEKEMSNGSLSDNITTVNVVAATLGYLSRNMEPAIQVFLNLLLKFTKTKLVVTRTVEELLFKGYDDKLLDALRQANTSLVKIPFKKFGYFVERNNSATYDGVFGMDTGAQDLGRLGIIDRWNYESQTQLFGSPCGKVQGSSGDLWPPVPPKQRLAHIFVPDFCFALRLEVAEPSAAQGLKGIGFAGTAHTFDTGEHFPDTHCQCSGECQPAGTLNASACRWGSPLFVSFPHFHLADPVYLQAVSGLKPNASLHRFYLALEPVTGIPLEVTGRLQLNVLLQNYSHLSLFNTLHGRVFLPTLWFTQSARVTEQLAGQIRPLIALNGMGWDLSLGLAGLGVGLMLLAVALQLAHSCFHGPPDAEPLLSDDSVDSDQ